MGKRFWETLYQKKTLRIYVIAVRSLAVTQRYTYIKTESDRL